MNKERNSNFEMLRIISMFFIVLYHVILHGNIIGNVVNPNLKIIFEFIMLITLVHVDSYVLVTGYFQSKSSFKQSKLLSILIQCLFYRVLIVFLLYIFKIRTFSNLEIFYAIFPLNLNEYWFIGNYLILYCLSPYINKFIDNITKQEYQKTLLILTIIFSVIPYLTGNIAVNNSGFTLYNFIYLYLIGAYIRRYPLEDSYFLKRFSKQLLKIMYILIFIFCVVINYCISATAKTMLYTNSVLSVIATWCITMTKAYSNPFIIVQTIAYFAYFKTLNIKSKFINIISSLTLGVYLIHDNNYIRDILYKWTKIDIPGISSGKFIFYAIGIAICIFVICLFIELIRKIIFNTIKRLKISKIIRNKYYNTIKDIYIKEIN